MRLFDSHEFSNVYGVSDDPVKYRVTMTYVQAINFFALFLFYQLFIPALSGEGIVFEGKKFLLYNPLTFFWEGFEKLLCFFIDKDLKRHV